MTNTMDSEDKKLQRECLDKTGWFVVPLNIDDQIIDYQVGMLDHNNIDNLLKPRRYNSEAKERKFFCYDTRGLLRLSRASAIQKLNRDQFVHLILNIVNALKDMDSYGLSYVGLIKDRDSVFVTPKTSNITFVYLPLYERDGNLQVLGDFIEILIADGCLEDIENSFADQILNRVRKGTTLGSLSDAISELHPVRTSILGKLLGLTTDPQHWAVSLDQENNKENEYNFENLSRWLERWPETVLFSEPYLEYIEDGILKEIKLDEHKPITFGRENVAVSFACQSKKVSRIHARVIWNGKKVLVTDNDSKNGTYINDILLCPHIESEVVPSDNIRFGDVSFILKERQRI